MKSWPSVYILTIGAIRAGVAVVVGVLAAVMLGVAVGSTAMTRSRHSFAQHLADEGEDEPGEVRAAADAAG